MYHLGRVRPGRTATRQATPLELRLPDRQPTLHRLSRVLGGVQGRARGAPRGGPYLGQVRREGRLSRDAAHLPGHSLQPLRGRALRGDLSHHGPLHAEGRHRRLRPAALHRLQGLHAGLPLRRPLHRPQDRHRGQVQLLRAQGRGGAGASLRDRVPHPGHRGGGPGQPGARASARSWAASRPRCASPRRARGPRSTTSTGTPTRWCRRRRLRPPTTCGPRLPSSSPCRPCPSRTTPGRRGGPTG